MTLLYAMRELFTEVRGIGILRSWTSALRSSRKLAARFGWWHHACCGGDIPRWLKWESPVVELIEERSPDQSSNDRKSYGRVVPDYVHHLDPRILCPLPPCAGRPPLHRRCRRRRQREVGRVLGADPHHRERRHRRRAVARPQAGKRD